MPIRDPGQARSRFLCRQSQSDLQQGSPIEMLDQMLMRLVWLEQKRWAHILAQYGLTAPQFLALAAMWEQDSGCHMGELAGETLQSSATMTGIVDRLVRMNLVRRQALASDRRVVLIGLTEEGRSLLVRVRRDRSERLAQTIERLPRAEWSELIRLIALYLDVSEQP